MTIFVSTARRRELGAGLRRLRESRGINGIEMATRLCWTQTMLSRVESGKRAASVAEVATYTGLCGVTGDQQQALLDLVDEPDDYRVKPHGDKIPDELRTLMFQESTAATIESYEPLYVPGITQTFNYARALFQNNPRLDAEAIDRCAAIRVERREVLTKINPAQCTLYVHENALRSVAGSPAVMAQQMMQLLFASGRPQCSIRVVPQAAGTRGLAPSAFQIFGYHNEPSVVYLEHQTTSEFLESKHDLKAFREVLNRVASVALTEAQSRDLITWLASDYEQGAGGHEDGAGGTGGLAQE